MSARTEYLSFSTGGQLYALPLERVREIVGLPALAKLPGGAPALLGVSNLRGTIISLVDLGLALGLGPLSAGKYTVAVVCESAGANPVALVVDRAEDVVSLGPGDLRPAPAGQGGRSEPVAGLADVQGQLLVVLDLDLLLAAPALGGLGASA